MDKLASLILYELEKHNSLKAKDIAKNLGKDRKLINRYLHSVLKNHVLQVSDYSWCLSKETQLEGESSMDETISSDKNQNFAFDSLNAIRNRLLDLTGRNRLLNFRHGRSGFIRVIDEMPDQLASNILEGNQFTFIPVDEPRKDELIKYGYIVLNDDEEEVRVKSDPTAKEWAKVLGFNTNYELPHSVKSRESKHNDTNIQSLLFPRELEAQLRSIRVKANTAIEETGANILYLAFGFLEWFEDENSSVVRQAPLYLIPVKIEKASLNKELGTYTYTIEHTGEDIISNLSLREKLKHDFHLELPEIEDEILPEEYFSLVEKQLLKHKSDWSVRRFATLAMFDFGKLLMYLDLDPERWPNGSNNIQNHAILQQFFAKEGEERESSDVAGFGTEYPIDNLEDVHELYPLIDDADSSQHSALVDAIKGKNLVIEGPPGSGKSQTITNLIAAAMAQGKTVLFVAEKMAALQVVKSRLARAGLGDFCLELHSHKTQKKNVYENIKQRIDHQGDYRYPSSIDLDIKMYEEKKEKLSNYAKLINSVWKNTGKTIHQIFTSATRYREEFTKLKIDELKPKHLNGDNFNDVTARRTADELKRYASVYDEVRSQLGQDADIDEHPWFGLYNKSIQVFDADEICQLLMGFDTATAAVLEELSALVSIINEDIDATKPNIKSLVNDALNLPRMIGLEDTDAIAKLNPKKVEELNQYLEQYSISKELFSNLSNIFEPEALESRQFENLVDALEGALGKLKLNDLTPTNIYQQLKLTQSYRDFCLSVSEDLDSVLEQDPSLRKLLSSSVNGFKEFETYLKLVDSLDVALVNRRNSLFDNDDLDVALPELATVIQEMKPLHETLDSVFRLDQLPPVAELKEMYLALESTNLFSWFKGEWRAARGKLFPIAICLKPKLSLLLPHLKNLIRYKELSDTLDKNNRYETLLKHEYKGVFTPIDEIQSLRDWYAKARSEFGIGFGKRVSFAESMFEIRESTFKGIQHLAKTKTLYSLHELFQLNEQLCKVFKTALFDDKDADLRLDGGIESFSQALEKTTRSIQSLCKKELKLSGLVKAVGQLKEFLALELKLKQSSLHRELFVNDVTLSPREGSEQNVNVIQATLELYAGIDGLKTSQLKNYLLSEMKQDTLTIIQSALDALGQAATSLQTTYDEFRARVELDESAWFKKAQGDLNQWREKSTRALSQPRWLSTWVDFIRIRESLSNEGLENLLRSTERGEIDLDTIEQIFFYSVFDTLAREVITQNQELAYFSGADQNAVRKQFREYDNKLKRLQQEKIAYQIAQAGRTQTVAGISSGKVSSYNEMGLINNEVNKKSRHVPIRQLVRRASKSLVALKPCFMMGPHSVAQYLAPGQIEFDLIVMDEASQIKPEDALGTIARGKQLVVVGDPKQLPPTSFFDKAVESDEEDTTAIEQSESILDVSFPMFNARRLRWHYRSRHESLIAFSNQEFYDSNLVVFPSPSNKSHEFGIKFTHVKTGRFVNQHNIEEAKVIARAVQRHIVSNSHESIGVVAMSSKQREQIERCVEELSKDDPQFREALAENANSDEPLFLKNLENVQGDERDVIYISCTYGPQEAGAAQMPQRFGPINSAAGGRRLNVLFTRSKKRMHIFSSMTEGHILANETSSPGVHALKNFLNFAQTGKLPQIKHTGKDPDSDFEIAVMSALKMEGFTCVPQVGVAGYFIDLAVQDPGQPGRYIMGIECDGATYHSAKSARDRDRLRQSVLESLGWNIKRIWSTDWFKNPQAQLKPIIEQLHQLKTDVAELPKVESEEEQIELDVEQESIAMHELDIFSHSSDSLTDKLKKFEQQVIVESGSNVPKANSLLRPAMIDALCEFRPISKSEFLEVIPPYLRRGTSPEHGKFIESVLNIIAEDEEEIALRGTE